MGKKINPARQPATMADVLKAKRTAASLAETATKAIFYRTLLDKFSFTPAEITRFHQEVNSLADAVSNRTVSIPDIVTTLREEDGIDIRM